MIFILILAALALLAALIDAGLMKLYQNPKQRHRSTPEEFGIRFQEIRFPTANDCNLYGWWMPAPKAEFDSAPTLILAHGWGRNVDRMLPYIRNLRPGNYHLLAFDARNHGSSDSDRYSSLPKFAEDIRAAVDFVEKQVGAPATKIGVLGLSLGGAAAIYAAALDQRISSVVTVGAFAHPAEIMRLESRRRHIPYFPVVLLMFQYVQFKIGARFEQIAPVNNIRKTDARILLVHGEQDTIVPLEQAGKLAAAGNPERVVLWKLPGRGHSDCHLHPEFWRKVDAFLHRALRGEPVT